MKIASKKKRNKDLHDSMPTNFITLQDNFDLNVVDNILCFHFLFILKHKNMEHKR